MRRATLFALITGISWNVAAQQASGTAGFLRPLDASLFRNCSNVESRARDLAREIPDRVYFMELYPRDRLLYSPFPSEEHVFFALDWIARYKPQGSSYALFYAVNGTYTFRCRDDRDRFFESASPEGDPLRLKLATGEALIWHFFLTPINAAHVFVTTDIPLEKINGEDLMAEVKQRLAARFVYLYVRNDPWFLGYAPDSLPYIFTTSFKKITEKQYRSSRTMACETGQKCQVGPSWP